MIKVEQYVTKYLLEEEFRKKELKKALEVKEDYRNSTGQVLSKLATTQRTIATLRKKSHEEAKRADLVEHKFKSFKETATLRFKSFKETASLKFESLMF